MKLKKKMLSLGLIVAVSAPIAIAVSCGTSSDVDWNANDDINAKTPNIKINFEDSLTLENKDGQGTFQLGFSINNEKLLQKAKYTKKIEVKYFKEGVAAKWKDVTNAIPNDLSNYDEIKITLKTKGDYLINGKDEIVYETGRIGEDPLLDGSGWKFGDKMDWFTPAAKSPNTANVVSVDSVAKKIVIDLEQYTSSIKMNELTFKIAKELGYLFSETKVVKSFTDVITKPDGTKVMPTNALLLKDIYDSLVSTLAKGIDKLEVKYKTFTKTLDLSNVLTGVTKGETFIKPYKDRGLENGSSLASIFISAPKTPEFLSKYQDIAVPLTIPLLSLIAGMANDKAALQFFPELAVNYGDVFGRMIQTEPMKEWAKDNLVRQREIDSMPQIFMATLFRK